MKEVFEEPTMEVNLFEEKNLLEQRDSKDILNQGNLFAVNDDNFPSGFDPDEWE